MLEHTDNVSSQANTENVSEHTSTPAPESTADNTTIPDNELVADPSAQETHTETPTEETHSAGNTADKTSQDDKVLAPEEAGVLAQFEAMELNELLDFFASALKKESIQHLKPTIEPLIKVFNQKLGGLEKTQKEAFIADGDNPDAFYFNPPIKKEFETLYRRYKSDRSTYYRSQEEKQKKNLAQRIALIEELKGLISLEQDINITYNQFKDLQKRWKETGQIPRMEANDVWRTYHHHVGHFYDFLHLNRELRELDYKFNLEEKLKICEQAEALTNMEDISKAFRHLQNLHKRWKDELGPVDKEHSENIWERFSNATKIIHEKRRYFLKNQEDIFEANFIKKRAVLEQIENLLQQEILSKTNIHQFTKTYEGLRETFVAIGKVPTKKRDELWSEFKIKAKRFRKKREQYYKKLRLKYDENTAKREAIISEIEALKSQPNTKETRPKIVALQKEWKTIGPVSRTDHKRLWDSFKEVCDDYFSQLNADRDKASAQEKENLSKKRALLEELKTNNNEIKSEADLDAIVEKWNTIGFVPRNKVRITQDFNALVEKAYASAGLSKAEITQKSYQNRLDNIRDNKDSLRKELHGLNRRIDETKQEIIQLETNLQFFGKNQDKNPIVTKVQKDISGYKERLLELKEKKRLVKQLQKD